jgi:periplasmic protein TonB
MAGVAIQSGGLAGGGKRWGQRAAILFGLLCLAGAVVWGGMNLSNGASAPKRQVARIMVLPDAPPPPPPDEKRPPPKEEPTRQQISTPKQETPPAPAQLKMEGQAGEGPSAFAAGDVKQEYIGGDIGNGSLYSAYVARLEQRIQVELTKHNLRVANVRLFVWLAPDGSIQRYTIQGGDGNAERSLRAALADFDRADEAPLANMPMPIGLSIN